MANKLVIRATFKTFGGPRVDGGYVIQFDVPGALWPEIAALPTFAEKSLILTVQEDTGAETESEEDKTQREKDLAHSSILIKKLNWDTDMKNEFVASLFNGRTSRTELTDEELSRLVNELAILTGDRPPVPTEEPK